MSSQKNDQMQTGLGRRQFAGLAVGSLLVPNIAWAKDVSGDVVLYDSAGPELFLYHVAENSLALSRATSVQVPATIQYVWPHPSKRILYVAYSNRSASSPGDVNGVALFNVDEKTGQLQPFGQPLQLNNRPINITIDPAGTNLLVAFNAPAELDVYPINADGSLGAKIQQQAPINTGIYDHQVRVAPSGHTVILVSRGNDATSTTPEDPGAIKVFDFHEGQLSNEQSIAPHNGYGFGPRHLDFHPNLPLVYVSMERENQLQVFSLKDGVLSSAPIFVRTTLADPSNVRPGQVVGPIHFSRDGRFVYLANRSDGTVEYQGKKVYIGGENSVAVFSVDPQSGEPTLIQTIPTLSYHCRTFTLHPNGNMLVTASIAPMLVREGDTITRVSAALTVFRVQEDGKLTFIKKYDVDTAKGPMFWCGLLSLDAGWGSNQA